MDENQLREATLYYHREPKPGKIAVTPHQTAHQSVRPVLAYSPGLRRPAMPSSPIRRADTLTAGVTWSGWSPTAPPFWAWHRSGPGRQAGDGRQGRAVQEIRRHRRLRSGNRRERDPDKLIDIIAAWSPPSAASTWRTSRRRSVSTSKRSFASG